MFPLLNHLFVHEIKITLLNQFSKFQAHTYLQWDKSATVTFLWYVFWQNTYLFHRHCGRHSISRNRMSKVTEAIGVGKDCPLQKGTIKKCFPTREGPWLLNTSTKQPSYIWLYYCNRIKKPHSVSFIKKYIISHLNIIKNELNLLVLSQSWHVSFSIYFCMIHFDEKTLSVGQAMVASSSSHCIALMRLVKFDICFYLLYTGCFI